MTLPKFRKKPVMVEAHQYSAGGELKAIPEEFQRQVCTTLHMGSRIPAKPHIHTLEGEHQISPGDWILKGVKGEFYPCKPDIFEMTYELASSAPRGDWKLGDVVSLKLSEEVKGQIYSIHRGSDYAFEPRFEVGVFGTDQRKFGVKESEVIFLSRGDGSEA